MKKSLLLLAMGLMSIGTYAQDDDVYFVPSSKSKIESNDTYTAPGRSSYTPIADNQNDANFESSDWANGRGNGKWDVDEYNRRGRNYKHNVTDTISSQQSYDQGYADGYEDGSCTARIVRFWSPRAGIYVSSPYYLDYYDLCYDPFFYGYASPWTFGWSSWWGWGSWYGWRPYYSSWYGWGWGGWYDPWYDPWYNHGWGWHNHYGWTAWRPSHIDGGNWRVGNTHQPFVNAGNRTSASNGWSGRGNNLGFSNNRPAVNRNNTTGFNNGNRPSVSGSKSRTSRTIGGFDYNNNRNSRSNRSTQSGNERTRQQYESRPSRSFNNTPNYSTPSRSMGGGFNTGSGSFGGSNRGGGRSFGGRR